MLTTPLRSENIPAIAAKTSGVENTNIYAISRRVEDDAEVRRARAVARIAEPDAEHPGRDRPRARAGARRD